MRISDWSSDVCSSDLAEGKTVIIVTHDASVAARAERVIEISDGSIVADRRNPDAGPVGRIAVPGRTQQRNRAVAWRASLRAVADRFTEAFVLALRSMKAHRLRTFLTMLGIIIGIASVVCVVSLGEGQPPMVRGVARHSGGEGK